MDLFCYCNNNPVMYSDWNGKFSEYLIPSYISDYLGNFFLILFEGGSVQAYFDVVNAVRPNNIAEGLFLKQQAECIKSFDNDIATANKAGNIISGVTIALQTIGYAAEDLINDVPIDKVITNSVVNAGSSIAIAVISSKIGAGIGTLIPIPIVGTLVGTVVGCAVGLGLSKLMDININGKTITDHAKDFAYNSYKFLSNKVKGIFQW